MVSKYSCIKCFRWSIYLFILFVVNLIFKSAYLLEADSNKELSKIFIFSAYRISDGTIRILYLKSSKKINLYFRFRVYDKLLISKSICQRSNCPTFHDPFCILNGYLATIEIPLIYQHTFLDSIELSTSTEIPLKTVHASVKDARPKFPSRHFLGICLQPIFYLISPKPLISFFEFWISQEVSVFYIYRHSWSSEVEAILNFYSKHPKITVKLIDWGDLPRTNVEEGSPNPNNLFRRLEFSLAMADCVYQGRRETEFLVMTDLDEIIFIKSLEETVAKFIQQKATRDTMAFWFSSAKIIGKSNKTQIWQVLEKPVQAKLIVNAELTKSINVHAAGRPEYSTRNEIFSISPNQAVIIHSRFDYDAPNESLNSNILSMKNLAQIQNYLDFNVDKVLKLLKISSDKLEKEQRQIFEDFDQCAEAFKGKPLCKSIYSCQNFLTNFSFIETKLFKVSSSSWRIL